VSPAAAVRLGKLFGDGAGVWVRMLSGVRVVARLEAAGSAATIAALLCREDASQATARGPPPANRSRFLSPRRLIAAAMDLTVMRTTERHRELIAQLATEGTRLREAQVVRIRRPPTANQAWLFHDMADMLSLVKKVSITEAKNRLSALIEGGSGSVAIVARPSPLPPFVIGCATGRPRSTIKTWRVKALCGQAMFRCRARCSQISRRGSKVACLPWQRSSRNGGRVDETWILTSDASARRTDPARKLLFAQNPRRCGSQL